MSFKNKVLSEKQQLRNKQLSLSISIGTLVMKRFLESSDPIARSVIATCAEHSNSPDKREAFKQLLNASVVNP
jgi:hypothetical protein